MANKSRSMSQYFMYYVVSSDYKIIAIEADYDLAQGITDKTNIALSEYGFEPTNWIFCGTHNDANELNLSWV